MRRIPFVIAAVLIAQGLHASPATAAAVTILAKPVGTMDDRVADRARCASVVARAPSSDYPQSGSYRSVPIGAGAAGGVPGVAGAAIAGLIIGLIELGEDEERAESLCMRNLGYAEVPLTEEEAAAFRKMPAREKAMWEAEFLNSDLHARIAAVLAPKVERLPAYRAEPFSQGGLKVLRDSLSLADDNVTENAVVLTGTAVRSRTAILTAAFETTQGPVRVAADEGTVFHQVDYRPQTEPLLRPDGATWCGPVRQVTGSVGAKDLFCFTGFDDGYRIYRPSGQPWMAGPYTNGFVLSPFAQNIHLEERAADDLGPLDFEIVVVKINRRSLDLIANVGHGGKKVRVFNWNIRFDEKGLADLPLWDRRLVFTRDAKGHIVAQISEDGTGLGWRAGG